MPYRFHPTKRALYKLLVENSAELSLLDLPKSSRPIRSFSYTFMCGVPTFDKVSLGWVTGVVAHIGIRSDTPYFVVEQHKPDGSLPQRKEIEVTFDELIDFGLVEIVPDNPRKHFFGYQD